MLKAICLVGGINITKNQAKRNKITDLIRRVIKFLDEERNIFYWVLLLETLIDIYFYDKPFPNDQLNPLIGASLMLYSIPPSHV